MTKPVKATRAWAAIDVNGKILELDGCGSIMRIYAINPQSIFKDEHYIHVEIRPLKKSRRKLGR